MTTRRFLSLGRLRDIPHEIHLGTRADGDREAVMLSDQERSAHTYLCGITGSGKSRFLENMITQDITRGYPLCLIDPTGALYRQSLEYVATCLDHAKTVHRCTDDQVKILLDKYLFLDADDPENPLTINPLEPHEGETTEEIVDDILKVIERLFGSIDEMRRIRQTLRNTLWVVVELNRLMATKATRAIHESPQRDRAIRESPYHGIHFVGEFLSASSEQRCAWLESVPRNEGNKYVLLYFQQFFAQYTQSQRMERLESTWNILQYFLGDVMVSRVLGSSRSTIHIPDIMRKKKSLFCSFPLGKNLKGTQLLGAFIATKFQRSAYRRTPEERQVPYSLYIDEFHEFADIEFAKASATLRQYNLRMINAHQSQSQPPFHTEEGQSILNTIKGNALVKVLFRLPREDAEIMAKEVFELTQSKLNFITSEENTSSGHGTSQTETHSTSRSQSSAENTSKATSHGSSHTQTKGHGRSHGMSHGQTITHGTGRSFSRGRSYTETETETIGMSESISTANGQQTSRGTQWNNGSNERHGTSYRSGHGTSHAEAQGITRTQTSGNTTGETTGQSHGMTQGMRGTSTSNPATRTDSGSHSSNTSHNRSNAQGESTTQTSTQSSNTSHGHDTSFGTSRSNGGSSGRTTTETTTMSHGTKHDLGHGVARGQSQTLTTSENQSRADAVTISGQVSKNRSKARQESTTTTHTIGSSVTNGKTDGESFASGTSATTTSGVRERKVYFTLEGERELLVNRLQKLPKRSCIVAKEGVAVEVITATVPDWYYLYQNEALPEEIIAGQKVRLVVKAPQDCVHSVHSVEAVHAVHSVEAQKNEPRVEWFPEW